MDYKKMTETRQSCRAFDPVRTPDRAVLTQVLEAARLAPSAAAASARYFSTEAVSSGTTTRHSIQGRVGRNHSKKPRG